MIYWTKSINGYYALYVFSLTSFILKELDADFCSLQIRKQQCPVPLPDVKPMYCTKNALHNFISSPVTLFVHHVGVSIMTFGSSKPSLILSNISVICKFH